MVIVISSPVKPSLSLVNPVVPVRMLVDIQRVKVVPVAEGHVR